MKSPRRVLTDATSTPLASIFGSGFLVIVPILNGIAGAYSVVATPLLPALQGEVSDEGLIVPATTAAAWLSVPLVAAAVFSQFSAAVAVVLAFITLFAVPAG